MVTGRPECLAASHRKCCRQLPRPAPLGAHKRRPYEWLFESATESYCAGQLIPMPYQAPFEGLKFHDAEAYGVVAAGAFADGGCAPGEEVFGVERLGEIVDVDAVLLE